MKNVNANLPAGSFDTAAILSDENSQINADLALIDSSLAKTINALHIYSGGTSAGLKDASGNTGDFFIDSSLYLKLSGAWHTIKVTDLSLG